VQCIDNLVDNLNTYLPGRKITFITGVMADKDFRTIFERVIPIAKRVFTITPDNPPAFSRESPAKRVLHERGGAGWRVRVRACANTRDAALAPTARVGMVRY